MSTKRAAEQHSSTTHTVATARPEPGRMQNRDSIVLRGSTTSLVRQPGGQRRTGRILKRALDLTFAVPVVTLLLPVLCVGVRIAQWWQSPGSLFYCQRRLGRDGVPFTIFKFRTMNEPPKGRSDIEEDPADRIYPIGTLLRRSKIDEIPQFINVLLGHMSVVGPRPHHEEDCHNFSRKVSHYSQRWIVKPGITGLAQYSEYRGDFAWNCVESRVDKDLTYIGNWSLWLDLTLILKTIVIVTSRVFEGVMRRIRPAEGEVDTPLTIFAPEDQQQTAEPVTELEERRAA